MKIIKPIFGLLILMLYGCGTFTEEIYSRAAQSIVIQDNSPQIREVLDSVTSKYHFELQAETDAAVWWFKPTMKGKWTQNTYTLVLEPKLGRIRLESQSTDNESTFARNVLQSIEEELNHKGVAVQFYDDDRIAKTDFGPYLEHTRYPSEFKTQNNE